MRILRKRRDRILFAVSLLGLLLLVPGVCLLNWHNAQEAYFNAGLAAFEQGDMPTAVKLMDKSLAAYQHDDRNFLERLIVPAPDRYLAARADFQKGKAYIALKKPEAAADAFVASLQLDTGTKYTGLTLDQAQHLAEANLPVKYDLLLLYRNNPETGKKQGKDGDGPGQPGTGQQPAGQSGNQPGKGKADAI